ncbi:MAG TPA: hypothetical protein VN901_29615 [Candidatus Acidoferrales bacterium]|nr:hypothetical protein [Candidatus Acidoferrales bacterium]
MISHRTQECLNPWPIRVVFCDFKRSVLTARSLGDCLDYNARFHETLLFFLIEKKHRDVVKQFHRRRTILIQGLSKTSHYAQPSAKELVPPGWSRISVP